jgi:hypothetical protein
MNRRSGSLSTRVEKLEQVSRPEGDKFYMIWGKTEADLADALSEAKTSGALVKGGRFDIRLWTHAAEPPPPRWTTLAEMDRDELTIIAGREDGKTTAATDTGVARLMSDGEISTWYANNLPPVT